MLTSTITNPQLQQLVVSGKLHCSKDEAAALAGIQLRIEESCPPARHHPRKFTPPTMHSNLRTIAEEFKESPPVSDVMANEASNPDTDEASQNGNNGDIGRSTPLKKSPAGSQTGLLWRRSGFLRQCMPIDKNKHPLMASVCLNDCVPPTYHNSKNMARLVKEQKRKLFHTSVYENEIQLKKLYIQTCKRLPVFGCQVYQVKELLRGKTKKKATRLLGIGAEKIVLLDSKTCLLARTQPTNELQQWRAGGGRSHDRLVLEFRGTKWSFVTPSASLKSITVDLWEIMQEMDNKFLDENVLPPSATQRAIAEAAKQRVLLQPFPSRSALYAEELDTLQRLLHFPEEVAFLLTETEHKLFHEVAPLCYVRHVTLDLSGQEQTSGEQTTVQALIKRFNELSSWVTHLIVSQPTHEDRKAVLSCMLRVALTCWNIGNFNASMEIVAGLRSDKLKPFWLSINEKEDRLRVMEFLTDALLTPQPSPQYEDAVQRALALPYCKVVPFFGHYLREIQAVFAGSPSMVVLCPNDSKTLEFVSDFHGEDHFMTRIGVGGLINVSKMESVLRVLRKVKWFHQHAWKLNKYLERKPSSCSSSLYDEPPRSNADSEYEVDLDVYRPIQPLNSDHGVSFIPLGRDPDLHTLQIMHHGTTVAHWDCDGSRLATVFLRLESSCATLTWCRPTWSALRGGGPPDYCLGAEPEVALTPGVILRYSGNETAASPGLEEGFLELSYVKEVVCGRAEVDLTAVERRLGLDTTSPLQRDCFSLVYGTNLSDNRVLDFVAPNKTAKLWFEGLVAVVRALHRQRKLSDQRLQWLREQYLQLYYSDGACMGPTPAEAINIFGGRKWTNGSQGSIVLLSEPLSSGFKKPSPFGMTSTKLRKKKSQTAIKELGSKSPQPPGTEEHKIPISSPTFRKSISSPPHSRPSHEEPIHRINTAPSFDTVEKFSYGGRDKPIRKHSGVSIGGEQSSHVRSLSITHSAQLDFEEFLELFRAFSLRTRRDLKELFEKIATTRKSTSDSSLSEMDQGKGQSGQNSRHHGLLTRVTADTYASHHRRKICDAFAVASIVANCTGVDTIRTKGILLEDFKNFLSTHQGENLTDEEVSSLIKRHEPDILLREQNCLSFEGFAQYLMDKDNYAFTSEGTTVKDDMDHPLSHYYTASSHNTYLTGHQLKGESSVELYSQVLLTGCRCVELDCWDGDDGMPLIYHGHTLTTKIPFKNVVEAINRSAFVSSPYPIILSIENHCSLQLQARMAQIFQSVFGEKLVSRFLFEGDFGDDPQLPTPNQLKYRILIKNKKLTVEPPAIMSFIQKQSKTKPTRNNSIVSNTSTASLNDDDDDDFDDDDDDDDLMDVIGKDLAIMSESLQTINGHDQEDKQSVGSLSKATSFEVRTESISSQEGFIKENLPSPPPQDDVEWKFDNITPKPKKQSTQIAQELSDLIIYTQAIKFRGLTPMSPTSSVKVKKGGAVKRAILPSSSSSPSTPPLGTELKLETTKEHTIRRQPSTASCYQVSSLNENHMKKLYRKHPLALIAHTERHLMRVYPAGMRIDSSNFNPIIFWAFGVQMVALNYQTEDSALHINTAMFEQNGGCGYVLKPRILWDKNHIMYRRFNPWDKEFDGLHCHCYTITVISGQYVCPGSYKSDSMSQPHTGNPQVEVEVTGIPNDCLKQKTRVVQRNALNPIWNETFIFKVMVGDFSFIKFSVYDVSTNHVTAQRVVPLRCLRPGYRHLRLRNSSNHPLPLSTLFIYSKVEEEWAGETQEVPRPIHEQGIEIGRAESKENASSSSIALKRRMFFLMVYGVIPEEPYTILKITQESTTRDVIAQALTKSGKLPDTIQDHILIEEVQRGWEKKDLERATTQRILAWDERPLEAQAQWQGEGRFILKKTGDDPSSRAWMSTIMGSAMKERRKAESSDSIRDWEYEETFHVCIHNVSPEIPYTILRAPISSTAQDVITQALVKARRLEDPSRFVLVEELDYNGQQDNTPVNKRRSRQIVVRTLADTESVYYVQTSWQVKGSIIMRERAEFPGDKKKSPSSRYASLGRFGKLRLSGSQKDKDRRLSMREREGRRREIGHWDHKANRARSDDGTGSFHDRYGASWGSSSTSKTTVEESEISVSPPTAVTSKQQQEMRVESCKASTDQSARQEGDPTDGEKGKKDPSADTSVPGTSRERQPIVAKLKKVSLQKLRGWR